MIIVLKPEAGYAEINEVVKRLKEVGCDAHVSKGQYQTVIGAVGDRDLIQEIPWSVVPGVERAVPVLKPYKFVSRDFQPENTVIDIRGVKVGSPDLFVINAGPCAVESRDQLFRTIEIVKAAGATIMRGDAFKPRTSPYAFQGLGEEALQYLAEAREEFDMPFVAEVLDPRDVALVAQYADILRIGTRNMANFTLLQEVGRQPKPVQLKRGFTATIEEWLNAAEYIFKEGNHQIIMVERGIRTFGNDSRNTLDVTAIPILKRLSHLPVIVDPSHSGGHPYLVKSLSLAGLGAGADGILVDVHPNPGEALCDGPQALIPEQFEDMMITVRAVAAALGRKC